MHSTGKGRLYGRAGFIGVVGAGIATLFAGRPVQRVVDAVASPFSPLAPGIAPTSGWRIYTVAPTMPTFDPATWRLQVDGLVRHPYQLDYKQLRALPRVEQVSTFHCVTGWTVRNVHWAGVRLQDIIGRAQPRADASALRFVSAEFPYEDSLSIQQAMLPDVLLAYEMDGQPLSRPHGAPVRLVIPDMYGYKNAKWVRRIELTRSLEPGYWEQNGYDTDAWVGRSNGL
jgi:DMSO/TMAO reductase YedYZ molybdopterin-dependent catalytic subunit